jgi:Autophagy protein Apg5
MATMSSGGAILSLESLQATNWNGSIPIVLTLAPTSLSSPTLPPPIHVLVPRHTYLHTGLQSAVLRLHKFAPTTLSFTSGMIRNEPDPGSYGHGDDDNDTLPPDDKSDETPTGPVASSSSSSLKSTEYPVCWFEDQETQIALRWHLFAGVLYDLKRDLTLPWKIRLHFTNYPSSQILPLEDRLVLTQIQNFFKNSLKQALCLTYGNSKAAMNLTKDSHGRLWDAVRSTSINNYNNCTSYYPLYNQVASDYFPPPLDNSKSCQIPIRLFVNARPPIQRPCSHSLQDTTTLGSLLTQWLPEFNLLFTTSSKINTTNDFNHSNTEGGNDERQKVAVLRWRVGGIQPALDTTVLDLWKALCHPDRFLYITVLVQ